MRVRKTTVLAVLASGLVFCTAIQGHETGATALRAKLAEGYERAPTRAELEPLTDDLDAALVAAYLDAESPMLVRMRALDLLSGHPSEPLRELLAGEIERPDLDAALRRRVLDAAVATYGESDPDLAARAVERAFESDDAMVRYEAARTLERLPDATTARVLGEKALADESDPDIQSVIRRAITPSDGEARP